MPLRLEAAILSRMPLTREDMHALFGRAVESNDLPPMGQTNSRAHSVCRSLNPKRRWLLGRRALISTISS